MSGSFTIHTSLRLLLVSLCVLIANITSAAQTESAPASYTPVLTDSISGCKSFMQDEGFKEEVCFRDSAETDCNIIDKPQKIMALRDTTDRNWWHLLKRGQLNLADTTVEYPRFLKFCVNVYNWADHVFNSYNPEYVVGTGRRWKARVLSDNWVDSYAMNIKSDMPIRIMSDIYCNAGAYIQYMAVSLGYSLDLSNIIGNKPANHKKLEYGFNCARFNVEGHFWENTGGSYLRKFGKYNNGKLFKYEFPGVYFKSLGLHAYYFFNNKKYSQGAAYNFSKYQIKSAGSFIIGFSYNNITYSLDLSFLPYKFRPFANIPMDNYRIHYQSYCLMTGYGYNWVLNPHLLFNISVFPEIGITHCYTDSYQGNRILRAMNIRGRSSLTYNLGDFFLCLIAKIDGNWYYCDQLSFFSSIENASLSVGVRF